MITIRQILDYLESGKTFSAKVVTYDRKRKRGGVIKEIHEAILVQNKKKTTEDAGRPKTNRELMIDKLRNLKKAPNHRRWYTRNIQLLQDGYPTSETRKIHPPLIIEFNGDKDVVI